jgi:DNA-binding transcriptional regulator YdaS (Cro superfamily)
VELVIAIIAAVAGLAGAWLGTWLGNRGAQDQWLREQRIKAYTDLIQSVQDLTLAGASDVVAIQRACATILVVGPAEVSQSIRRIVPLSHAFQATLSQPNGNVEARTQFRQEVVPQMRHFLVAAAKAIGSIAPGENWVTDDTI